MLPRARVFSFDWITMTENSWPGLLERWMTLSTAKITIQLIAFCFVKTYPLDSDLSGVIRPLNNWGLL